MTFGEAVLVGLGVLEGEAVETMTDVRRRDAARLDMQVPGGIEAGKTLIRGNTAMPEPASLTAPGRGGRALNEEAAALGWGAKPGELERT
jgi:glutathione-regulated potassium-efflux system protein KefB